VLPLCSVTSISRLPALQHYICWSELPTPRISVTFSLQEVEEIERDCAVYRGRLETIAKHSATSREEQVLWRLSYLSGVFWYFLSQVLVSFVLVVNTFLFASLAVCKRGNLFVS